MSSYSRRAKAIDMLERAPATESTAMRAGERCRNEVIDEAPVQP